MYLRPLLQYDLLNPEAGESSKQLAERVAICRQDFPDLILMRCLENTTDNVNTVYQLGRAAFTETILNDFPRFSAVYLASFEDFLTQSGRQY